MRGVPVRVLAASPVRTDPPCRYFGTCGGCQCQHVAYPAQLDWKRCILEELLVRVGKLEGVPVLDEAKREAPKVDPRDLNRLVDE